MAGLDEQISIVTSVAIDREGGLSVINNGGGPLAETPWRVQACAHTLAMIDIQFRGPSSV